MPAYISWEQFQRNQAQLQHNRACAFHPGAVREGVALLQGLLICEKCGNRLVTRYSTSKTFSYQCTALHDTYADAYCQQIAGPPLDAFITQQVLNALQPAALELSLQAASQLQNERQQLHQLWLTRIERATLESDRAARHYQMLEPENRLVARQLAHEWEAKLLSLQQMQEDYQRFIQQHPPSLSAQQIQLIRQLALDIPALWSAPTTTPAQHKQIIRQLIDHISIHVQAQSEIVLLSIGWQGGSISHLSFQRPVAKFSQLSYYPQLCQRVIELRTQGITCDHIALILNQEGFRPPKRALSFSTHSVSDLCRLLNITLPSSVQLPENQLQSHEWWLSDLAHTLNMPPASLYRWLQKGYLSARQIHSPNRWIIWADPNELDRLHQFRHRSLSDEHRQRWLQRYPPLQPTSDPLSST